MSQDRVILKIDNIHKRFAKIEVLRGINLEVLKGEIVGIIGPSGCGKSTLLRCINFLTPPDQGRVYFDGTLMGYRVHEKTRELKRLKDSEIAKVRSQMGMVFQLFNLW